MPLRMQPSLSLLDPQLIDRILAEAFALISDRGVTLQDQVAADLLSGAGARVENGIAHIPELLARRAIGSVPREFFLYNRAGEPAVNYGGNSVQFDPGSSCVHVLDPNTLEHRMTQTADLVQLVQVAELLPQFAAQSTAMVCNDVPKDIGDLYRLLVVLLYSNKPIVTGAFSPHTAPVMIDLLVADSGGQVSLRAKPRAIFDVCPSPPLHWSEFAARNLVNLALAWVPAEIISVPLAGAASPVTLAGTIVQHAAECISGITIHQLAQPGAPVVWGGAPAIFDMRSGIAPMGAIETCMLNVACSQVAKSLGLPTHGYLLGSDAKSVDAQAGQESGVAALMGVLGGINMISGAGMLDSLACHSPEKLVLDAESIAMAHRLLQGVQARTDSLALDMFAKAGAQGDFLKLPETRKLFRQEQYIPTKVVDRGSLHSWEQSGKKDAFGRAKERVNELVAAYQRPCLRPEVDHALRSIVTEQALRAGMKRLPEL
jgi:trimethylamine--corrinoid protein Co-methyltransferase